MFSSKTSFIAVPTGPAYFAESITSRISPRDPLALGLLLELSPLLNAPSHPCKREMVIRANNGSRIVLNFIFLTVSLFYPNLGNFGSRKNLKEKIIKNLVVNKLNQLLIFGRV